MSDSPQEEIQSCIEGLHAKDPIARQQAREKLGEIGSPAVPALLAALDDQVEHVRWEAAKALETIADPVAADKLARTLGDEDPDVRWVAGDALIALGEKALPPLLSHLTKDADADTAYEGAHHVVHELARGKWADKLQPLLRAFKTQEPETAVPVEAEKVLESL